MLMCKFAKVLVLVLQILILSDNPLTLGVADRTLDFKSRKGQEAEQELQFKTAEP